ncbi:MAG: hypothetical protein WKF87_09465 [Chryseolinea sp.]
MKSLSLTALLALFTIAALCQTKIANGEQPQLAVAKTGEIKIVFGKGDQILYTVSKDQGNTFAEPVVIATVPQMHLGMTRGPQLAVSSDYSIVTAMDKMGNIHSFKLIHKTGKWEKVGILNDVDGSAPEGLMSISGDDKNNFYAVWLDLREHRKNNICFASFDGSKWSKNRFAYKSPESSVCECCKPSIAVEGNTVSIMFRNWLKGSRDLYLITSHDNGASFSAAQKLGIGTWPLHGCPMDGGGLTIDSSDNQIRTAWQRDGVVYYAEPGKPEERLGEGRAVGMNGRIVSWEKGSDLFIKRIDEAEQKVGEGTALKIYEFGDNSTFAVWENADQIMVKKIKG